MERDVIFKDKIGLNDVLDFVNYCIAQLTIEEDEMDLSIKDIVIKAGALTYFTENSEDFAQGTITLEEMFDVITSVGFLRMFEDLKQHESVKLALNGIDEQIKYLTLRPRKTKLDKLVDKAYEFINVMEENYSQPEMVEFVEKLAKNEKLGSLSDLEIIKEITKAKENKKDEQQEDVLANNYENLNVN